MTNIQLKDFKAKSSLQVCRLNSSCVVIYSEDIVPVLVAQRNSRVNFIPFGKDLLTSLVYVNGKYHGIKGELVSLQILNGYDPLVPHQVDFSDGYLLKR